MNSSTANRAQKKKELWKCRVRGKSGKPDPGFPLFPPPLGNLANPARFPHSHSSGGPRLGKWKTKIRFPTFPHATRDDDDDSFQNIKIKTNPRRLRRPNNKQKRRTSRRKVSSPLARLPGSPRIGNETHFQAHLVLESNIDLRLTFGLENAYSKRVSQTTVAKKSIFFWLRNSHRAALSLPGTTL